METRLIIQGDFLSMFTPIFLFNSRYLYLFRFWFLEFFKYVQRPYFPISDIFLYQLRTVTCGDTNFYFHSKEKWEIYRKKHNIIFTMSNASSIPQESAALDSSRSRIATGTTIVSSAPPARPHWLAGASSPTPKTSFARNAPSRSLCKHGAAHNRHNHL